MRNIGIIGFGSMGKMLSKGFITSEAVKQENVFISTKTLAKVTGFKSTYKNINICTDNTTVIKKANLIFLCVPPKDIKSVLLEISPLISSNTHIISIAGYVSIKNIEQFITGKITKIIPSFVSEVKEGVTLVCHNNKIVDNDKKVLNNLLSSIGYIKEISENQFEIASDLTSCAPGLFSSIFDEFIKSAVKNGNINETDANEILLQTIYGLSKLYLSEKLNFNQTIKRVARKGGITEEGVKVIRNKIPNVFDEVFRTTLQKHEIKKENLKSDYK